MRVATALWGVAALSPLPVFADSTCSQECLVHFLPGGEGIDETRVALVDPKDGAEHVLGAVEQVQAVFRAKAGVSVLSSDGVYLIDREGFTRIAEALPGEALQGMTWSLPETGLQVTGYMWDADGNMSCTVAQWQDGAWQRNADAPPAACKAVGDMQQDLRVATCFGPGCTDLEGTISEPLAAMLDVVPGTAVLGMLQPEAVPSRLIFAYELGDEVHIAGPVVMQGLADQGTPFGPGMQVTLAQKGRLVLLAEQYTGAKATVFDMAHGKALWRSSGGTAVWLE